jgi:hypothetical protein
MRRLQLTRCRLIRPAGPSALPSPPSLLLASPVLQRGNSTESRLDWSGLSESCLRDCFRHAFEARESEGEQGRATQRERETDSFNGLPSPGPGPPRSGGVGCHPCSQQHSGCEQRLRTGPVHFSKCAARHQCRHPASPGPGSPARRHHLTSNGQPRLPPGGQQRRPTAGCSYDGPVL